MASKVKYRNEEERDKWMSVIKPEVMSSAESGEDDGEEVIIVRPLPWLSAEVTAFKQQLDEEIKKREKSTSTPTNEAQGHWVSLSKTNSC